MSRSCLRCSGEHKVPPGNLGFPSTEPFGHEFPSVSEEMVVVARFPGDTLHSSTQHPPPGALCCYLGWGLRPAGVAGCNCWQEMTARGFQLCQSRGGVGAHLLFLWSYVLAAVAGDELFGPALHLVLPTLKPCGVGT